MAALKEESYSNVANNQSSKKTNSLSEFTNKCEMNKKFKNKIFLDWNK
jgi:RNase P/RNase MRP subunit p30